MQMIGSRISCGVLQVHSLYGPAPEEKLKIIAERFYVKAGPLDAHTTASRGPDENVNGRKSAFVIFSDVDRYGGGRDLAEKITALNIGPVQKSGPVPNPSYGMHGSPIAVWCWTVDHDAFSAWYKKVRVPQPAAKEKKP